MRRLTLERSASLAERLTVDTVQAGLRVIGLSCLLFGVWEIREEARRRVAAAGIQLRHDTGFQRSASALPAYLLLSPAAGGTAVAGDIAVTDDAFWAKIAETAADRHADLALLESSGLLNRRWLLVPADGDLTALRAQLTPGAEITVFSTPPADTPTKGYTPPPAESYHGFSEGRSGTLDYESVSARRVPAFLAQAKRARRWALYPDSDATALTARVAVPQ